MSQERQQAIPSSLERQGVFAHSVTARQSLLQALICPACARPLTLEAVAQGSHTANLTCALCSRHWPLRQRTPLFTPAGTDAIPRGAAALLHTPDVENWTNLRQTLAHADPLLFREVFDFSCDAWRFLLPLPPEGSALVLGCGWGRFAASLAGICRRVYAVDSDPAHTRFVNARAFAEEHENLLAVTTGIQSLPFENGVFHLVVLENPASIGAWEDGRCAKADFARLRALLAPDGVLLVRCGARDGSAARWRRRLAQSGFAAAEELLSFPDCRAPELVLRGAPARRWLRLLQACAKTRPSMRRLNHAAAGCWLLAGARAAAASPRLVGECLPEGPWWLAAARSRPPQPHYSRILAVDPATIQPHFTVKVGSGTDSAVGLAQNVDVLERLRERLSPALLAAIPIILGSFSLHGRPAIAQNYLEGCSLAELLAAAPAERRPAAASGLLRIVTRWLGRFHRETASYTVLTEAFLNGQIVAESGRGLDLRTLTTQDRNAWALLAADSRILLGQRLPLVCAHGGFHADAVLLDEEWVRVPDWSLARFGQLPLQDFYTLVHSLAALLAGEKSAAAILATAYDGRGPFSQAVGICLETYCACLGIRPEWGRVLLPLGLLRQAAQNAVNGIEGDEVPLALCFLHSPASYPFASGLCAPLP